MSSKQNKKGLQKIVRKEQPATGSKSSTDASALKAQYSLIREDLTKLGNDLAKGYDMAKEMLDKKGLLKQLLKART